MRSYMTWKGPKLLPRIFHALCAQCLLAWNGGAIYNTGTLTVADCWIYNNTVENEGRGIENHEGTVTISSCTFNGNSSNHGGGGIYNSQSMVTVTNSTFYDNDCHNLWWGH